MKLISSLIASCLAFAYAQNDTTAPSPASTDMSTTMYTTQSIIASTKAYDPDSDPTDDFANCLYSWSGSFKNIVDVEICGYEGEDEIEYTDIKLTLPSNRWVAFGMKASAGGSYTSEDTDLSSVPFTNFDGYNAIIPLPIQSTKIMERYYNADATFMDLDSTIDVISDTTTDSGKRQLRLMRPMTVMNDTSANITVSDGDKYFDFADFTTCLDAARISVTFGPLDNKRFVASSDSFTKEAYDNRQAITTYVEYEAQAACDGSDSGDDASNIMVFGALIIGFIATLFHS